MKNRKSAVLFFITLFTCSLLVFAANVSAQALAKQTTTELLSDYDSAQPQKEFSVGIRFKMNPHWHIYWQYPGEFGLPTRVEFKLPAGYEVGELQWPAPERFMQSSNQVGYGYSNEVLLFASVKPSATAAPLKPEDLQANVKWLNCSESLCVPDSAKHQLTSFQPAAEIAATFKNWSKKVPIPASSAKEILKIQQQHQHRNANTVSVSLVLEWGQEPGQIQFFPALPKDLKIADLFISQEGLQSLVSFNVTILKGVLPEASTSFLALILPASAADNKQVYSFDVKL